VINPAAVEVVPTPAEVALTWTFNLLRKAATLVIFGLLLGWLAPAFVNALMEKTQTKTAASLGWGFVAVAAFFFAILVVIVVMGVGGAFFGALTLGGITAFIVWGGVLVLFALILGFLFAAFYLTQVVVAQVVGKLIFTRVNPAMAEHKFVPLIVGVVILAALMALPFIGWLFSLLATLIGLGAIWMWGSEMRQAGKAAQ
jgi:hypothetical protein